MIESHKKEKELIQTDNDRLYQQVLELDQKNKQDTQKLAEQAERLKSLEDLEIRMKKTQEAIE